MEHGFLRKVIEALLLVSEKSLTLKQLAELCPAAQPADIKAALKALAEMYASDERGIQLVEVAGGYHFISHPDCAEFVKKLYTTKKVFRLSSPALETLAIIAYKQPITRAEIEFIRGVNVDGVIKNLEERNLIKERGRKDVPGRPIMYGTAEEFLQYFGLKSLDDLPRLEEFEALALERERENEAVRGAEAAELPDEVPAEPAAEAAADEVRPEDVIPGDTVFAEETPGEAIPEEGSGSAHEHDEHSEITQ